MFQFFKNLRAEWAHISWPARSSTILWTVSVVIFAIIIGYYLGVLDTVFSKVLLFLISLFQ